MTTAPKGERLHVAFLGRRNVGKSALLNALARQRVSIVDARAGTTTDVVEKRMELLPLGPVLILDTAGIDDDDGALGAARVAATRRALDRADVVVLVAAADRWGAIEAGLLRDAGARPVVVVWSQCDRAAPSAAGVAACDAAGITPVATSAVDGTGIDALRSALLAAAPAAWLDRRSILGDLVPPGRGAVLVVPIDMEAPRGRLILPQVQTIRDLLDHDAWSLVVKERELGHVLGLLREPPALVVCDSQVFLKVGADCPPSVPLTSFSVLFARYKGDLEAFAAGAAAIDRLRPGDRVLIAESCSHHAIGDDIGRVKIPRWLRQYVGGDLAIDHVQGHDFPAGEALARYALVVHCGGCTTNRREILTRVDRCRRAGVPISNYGIAIAWSLGIAERALAPFPAATAAAFGDAGVSGPAGIVGPA